MNEQVDVVIVGSGVAGAVLAYRLSTLKKGLKILVLETGINGIDDPFSVTSSDRPRYQNLYALTVDRDSVSPYKRVASTAFAPQPTAGPDERHLVQGGPDPFKSNFARLLGGSTWAWRGNCPRFTPNDFRLKSTYHVGDDWPFSYDDLLPFYGEAEAELGIAGNTDEWDAAMQGPRGAPYPMKEIAQALGDQLLKRKLAEAGGGQPIVIEGRTIRVVATPQARISVPNYKHPGGKLTRKQCQGNASCIPICPTGAKYDASVHIKLAELNGVEFRGGCPVTRVRIKEDGKITGVSYRNMREDPKNDRDVDAATVVLACNAIETSRLWLYSKLDNARDLVGRNLMDHVQSDTVCFTPEAIFPFRGPQNTSSIPSFFDHPNRGTVSAFNISVGNDGWGRYTDEKGKPKGAFDILDELLWNPQSKRLAAYGKALQQALAADPTTALTHRLRLSFSTEQLPDPNNRVTLADDKDPLGIPRPKISYQINDYTRRSLTYARGVCRQILRTAKMTVEGTDLPNFNYSGAGHLMGTCRMGASKAGSVVDPSGKSWAHDGLWVVGSSVFVTGSCANPTVTLVAVTLKTAKAMAAAI